jgi:thiaminase
MLINSGEFVDYAIAHPSIQPAWKAYTEHEFVHRLANGSLPLPAFKHFLRQDYLYLVQYARLQGLAAYKCDKLDSMVGYANIILHIKKELNLHIEFCQSFGISKDELETGTESIACTVYTKYMESIGTTRDLVSLQVALAACLIGTCST